MAKRETEIRQRARAGTPIQVNLDTGASRALQRSAVTLASVANTLADEADRRAIIQAQREGTKVGAFGVPNLRDENTISGEAFNRAAIQTYTTRLELESRNALTRIATEHAADPAGFAESSRAYMQGVSEEINQVAPWLTPTYEQRYLLQEQQHLSTVNQQYAGLARDGARASVFELSAVIRRDQEENAAQLFSDDINTSTGAFARMLQDVQRVDGMMNQIGPDGLPLFSETERVKQMQALRDNMFTSGVRGFVRANGSSYELIEKLMDGEMVFKVQQFDQDGKPTGETLDVNMRAELSDQAYEGLIQFAKTQLVFENQVAAKREKQFEDIQAAEQKSNELAVWGRIEGQVGPDGRTLPPMTIPEIIQMADEGTIGQGAAVQMIKTVEVPGVDVSDPTTVVEAKTAMYGGDDIEAFVNENRTKLTRQDITSLLTENAKLQTGAPDMATEQRKNLFRALQPSGPLEAINPTGERVRNEAMTEYDIRVREGENPIEVRRDLESRVQTGIQNTNTGLTAGLVRPRFFVPSPTGNTIDIMATATRMQDALKNGNMSKQSYTRQVQLLQQWKRLQGQQTQQPTQGSQ